jgi:hypothetical protein
MNLRTAIRDAIAGLAVAAAVVLAMRYMIPDVITALFRQDVTATRISVMWVILAAIGLGIVCASSRRHPLICGVGGAAVLLVYLPYLLPPVVPAWYPDWLSTTLVVTVPSSPFVISGILLGVAAWHTVELVRTGR